METEDGESSEACTQFEEKNTRLLEMDSSELSDEERLTINPRKRKKIDLPCEDKPNPVQPNAEPLNHKEDPQIVEILPDPLRELTAEVKGIKDILAQFLQHHLQNSNLLTNESSSKSILVSSGTQTPSPSTFQQSRTDQNQQHQHSFVSHRSSTESPPSFFRQHLRTNIPAQPLPHQMLYSTDQLHVENVQPIPLVYAYQSMSDENRGAPFRERSKRMMSKCAGCPAEFGFLMIKEVFSDDVLLTSTISGKRGYCRLNETVIQTVMEEINCRFLLDNDSIPEIKEKINWKIRNYRRKLLRHGIGNHDSSLDNTQDTTMATREESHTLCIEEQLPSSENDLRIKAEFDQEPVSGSGGPQSEDESNQQPSKPAHISARHPKLLHKSQHILKECGGCPAKFGFLMLKELFGDRALLTSSLSGTRGLWKLDETLVQAVMDEIKYNYAYDDKTLRETKDKISIKLKKYRYKLRGHIVPHNATVINGDSLESSASELPQKYTLVEIHDAQSENELPSMVDLEQSAYGDNQDHEPCQTSESDQPLVISSNNQSTLSNSPYPLSVSPHEAPGSISMERISTEGESKSTFEESGGCPVQFGFLLMKELFSDHALLTSSITGKRGLCKLDETLVEGIMNEIKDNFTLNDKSLDTTKDKIGFKLKKYREKLRGYTVPQNSTVINNEDSLEYNMSSDAQQKYLFDDSHESHSETDLPSMVDLDHQTVSSRTEQSLRQDNQVINNESSCQTPSSLQQLSELNQSLVPSSNNLSVSIMTQSLSNQPSQLNTTNSPQETHFANIISRTASRDKSKHLFIECGGCPAKFGFLMLKELFGDHTLLTSSLSGTRGYSKLDETLVHTVMREVREKFDLDQTELHATKEKINIRIKNYRRKFKG